MLIPLYVLGTLTDRMKLVWPILQWIFWSTFLPNKANIIKYDWELDGAGKVKEVRLITTMIEMIKWWKIVSGYPVINQTVRGIANFVISGAESR